MEYSHDFNDFLICSFSKQFDFNEMYFKQNYFEAKKNKSEFILDYFTYLNKIDYADIFILINKNISIQCFYNSINLISINENNYLLLEIEKDNFLSFCSKEYQNKLFEIEQKDNSFFIKIKIDKIDFLKLDFYEM